MKLTNFKMPILDGKELENWLTSEEVCHLLRVSSRTLQTYRDSAILPFAQIGRKIYYRAADIQEYLISHYIKSAYQKQEGGVL